MERIGLGYKIVKENLWLWAVALGINFLGFTLGIMTKTLKLVPPGFHVKFSIPSGIPDVSNILQQPQTQGINIGGGSLPLFIVFLLLGPFLSGGFIASVFKILRGNLTSTTDFWANCKYYFLRLLAVNILTFILFLAILLPALAIFPLLGIVAILLVIYLTFFWQMTLVYYDAEIMEAFHKGKNFFKNNFSQVLALFLLIGILAAVISIPLNLIAQDVLGYGVAIIIWTFVGSIFSIAVMSFYNDLIDGFDLDLELD